MKGLVTALANVIANWEAETKMSLPNTRAPDPNDKIKIRLKVKQPGMIQQALDYRKTYGDPVSNLATLLSNIAVDPQRWQEIVDEPYG